MQEKQQIKHIIVIKIKLYIDCAILMRDTESARYLHFLQTIPDMNYFI